MLVPLFDAASSSITTDRDEGMEVEEEVEVESRNSTELYSLSRLISTELYSGWLRVFENYLLHGNQFDKALKAILEMSTLSRRIEEVWVGEGGVSTQMSWKKCLNALVDKACELGQLAWLCSLGGRQEQEQEEVMPSSLLYQAVSGELEELAFGSDVQYQGGGGGGGGVNYQECLFAFLLQHGDYRNASRVMFSCFERQIHAKTAESRSYRLR